MNELTNIDKLEQTLALVSNIEEALELKAQAEAFLSYVEGKYNADSRERREAQIFKLHTLRLVGKFLRDMEKNPGELLRGCTVQPRDIPTYEELGIEKTEAHRLQKLCSIQDEDFEKVVAEHNEKEKLLTMATLMRVIDPPSERAIQIPDFGDTSGWNTQVYRAACLLQTLLCTDGAKALNNVIKSFPDLFAMAIDGKTINENRWIEGKLTLPYYVTAEGEAEIEKENVAYCIQAERDGILPEEIERTIAERRTESPAEAAEMTLAAVDLQTFKDLSNSDPTIRLEALACLLGGGSEYSRIPMKDTYLRVARLRRHNENKNFGDTETQETISR